MKQILLLCQSEADILALPRAAASMRASKVEGIWVVYSPAILLNTAEASKEHDANIAAITASMQACAGRLDFDGAKQYKVNLDAAVLEKATKVREAWRSMSAEAQEKSFRERFDAFLTAKPAPNMKVTQHPDHYEPANWIECLNSLKGAWFPPFTPGSFAVMWPTSFGNADAASSPAPVPVPVPPAKLPKNTEEYDRDVKTRKGGGGNPMFADPRYRKLMAMTPDQIGQVMQELKVNFSGTVRKIAGQIWKHEQSLAVEAY